MIEGQYLLLGISGYRFLLPTQSIYTIENRNRMVLTDAKALPLVAMLPATRGSWPVYALATKDLPVSDLWLQAVFMRNAGQAVGIACDQINTLTHDHRVKVEKLSVIGSTRKHGSLYHGVWFHNDDPVYVFDENRLLQHLLQLAGPQSPD